MTTSQAPLRSGEAPTPVLGPDSMLWQYAGDARTYLVAPMTGLLLNMLPGVSAGIEQHSTFFAEPWARTMRSIPQIFDTVYDVEKAHQVRDYHHHVKGVDHHGERYHALNPELYFAAHAVFTYTVFTTIEVFDHRLSEPEKHRLYDECMIWYRHYGLSDRAMPADWDAFTEYWNDLCANVFEATPVARAIVGNIYPSPGSLHLPRLPRPVFLVARPLITDQAMLVSAALLPPAVRDTLGLRYDAIDRRRFGIEAAIVRATWRALPPRLRQPARVRAGKLRARQRSS